jgi:hypothetical protein
MGSDPSPTRVVPEPAEQPGTDHEVKLNEEKSVASVASDSLHVPEAHDEDEAQWQWQRYEEWKNYHPAANSRIELAYQKGQSHVRIRSGKNLDIPMELFFGDLVQYDPITGNARNIRRLGHESTFRRMWRKVLGAVEQMETGKVQHKSFLKYKKAMAKTLIPKKNKPPRNAFCHRICHSGAFIVLQMTAIILNTLVIGLDTEFNDSDASQGIKEIFAVIDHMFCAFFTIEILIRFGGMEKCATWLKVFRKIVKDKWFSFDLFLVVPMIIETWGIAFVFWVARMEPKTGGVSQLTTLRLLRLMRLSRIGRVARVLRFFPEIFMMMKSIWAAMRAVLCTFGMLLFLLYVFAIIFKARAEGTEIEEMFSSIFASMWRLLLDGAFMDNVGDTMEAIWESEPLLAFMFLLFIFLSNLTVLNMLIGVICEVANEVSTSEKERAAAKALKNDLLEFLDCFDTNDDDQISLREFELLLGNPDVKLTLESHDVDVHVLESLKEAIFEDKEAKKEKARRLSKSPTAQSELLAQEGVATEWKSRTFDELIQIILRFRGGSGNFATVLDVMDLEKSMTQRFDNLEALHATSKISNLLLRKDKHKAEEHHNSVAANPLPPPTDPMQDSKVELSFNDTPQEGKDLNEEIPPVIQSPVAQKRNLHKTLRTSLLGQAQAQQMIPPEDDLRAQMQDLKDQQEAFCREMRDQIRCLAIGQREIVATQARLGNVVRDRLGQYADDKCPEQAHNAPEDHAGTCQKPLGSNAASSNEWQDGELAGTKGKSKKAAIPVEPETLE